MNLKKNYMSPTIFNASNMKLSVTSGGNNSPVLEAPLEGALIPAIALSASMAVVIGRKDISGKAIGLPNRKI